MPQRTAVGEGRGTLGGIENQLNPAVFDGIDDVRAAFQHLVDLGRLDPLFGQIALGSRGGDGLEAERGQEPHRLQDARLVFILDRDEDGAVARQIGAAAFSSDPLGEMPLGPAAEVALQRTNLEVAPEIGFYALRCRDGT